MSPEHNCLDVGWHDTIWYGPKTPDTDTAAHSRCRDDEAGYFIGIPDTVDTTRIANVNCEQRSH